MSATTVRSSSLSASSETSSRSRAPNASTRALRRRRRCGRSGGRPAPGCACAPAGTAPRRPASTPRSRDPSDGLSTNCSSSTLASVGAAERRGQRAVDQRALDHDVDVVEPVARTANAGGDRDPDADRDQRREPAERPEHAAPTSLPSRRGQRRPATGRRRSGSRRRRTTSAAGARRRASGAAARSGPRRRRAIATVVAMKPSWSSADSARRRARCRTGSSTGGSVVDRARREASPPTMPSAVPPTPSHATQRQRRDGGWPSGNSSGSAIADQRREPQVPDELLSQRGELPDDQRAGLVAARPRGSRRSAPPSTTTSADHADDPGDRVAGLRGRSGRRASRA